MKIRFCLWFGALLVAVSGSPDKFESEETAILNQTFFISEIFDKYGNNNVMTYEGFEHLLENLGLGRLKFERQHDVSIHKINGTFREVHDELSLHRHNHNRNERNDYNVRQKRNVKKEENDEKTLMQKCLTAQDILATYGLKPYHEVLISPSKYLQICPAIVYELDQKICREEEVEGDKQERSERHLVWIYASISILVMGVSGLLCVLIVPLFRNHRYPVILEFLISLAVGTLCGDALIHLMPQIFSSGQKLGSEVMVVLRGTLALSAIYLFFIIENVLNGLRYSKKKGVEGRETGAMLQPSESHVHCHSHGMEGTKTVAWMAIMGDILHNVTDGLSIGAAFETSLSSGFASAIAIFCHELPHEMGDYAILLASGMSMKKSLFYNIVSSVFSFIGMVVGVVLGKIQDAALWINAFTAGSFLYIALSDLVPELKTTQSKSSYKSFIVQTMGLAGGAILMFTIALYEDQIESLLR